MSTIVAKWGPGSVILGSDSRTTVKLRGMPIGYADFDQKVFVMPESRFAIGIAGQAAIGDVFVSSLVSGYVRVADRFGMCFAADVLEGISRYLREMSGAHYDRLSLWIVVAGGDPASGGVALLRNGRISVIRRSFGFVCSHGCYDPFSWLFSEPAKVALSVRRHISSHIRRSVVSGGDIDVLKVSCDGYEWLSRRLLPITVATVKQFLQQVESGQVRLLACERRIRDI